MLVSETTNKSNRRSVQDDSSAHRANVPSPSSGGIYSEENHYILEKNTYTHYDHQPLIHKRNLRGGDGLSKRISSSNSSPKSVTAVKQFDMDRFALDCRDPIAGNRISDTDCRRKLSTRTISSTPEAVTSIVYDSDSTMSLTENSQEAADELEDRATGIRDFGKELYTPAVPTPPSSSQTHPAELDIAWLRGGGTIPLEAKTYHHRSRSHSSSIFPIVSYLLKPVTYFIQYLSVIGEWVEQTPFRSWVVLGCAISIEILATILLKAASDSSSGVKDTSTSVFSSTCWMTMVSLFMDLSSILAMGATLKQIEVGVAYAVWSAVGTAVVSIVGIIYWDESKSPTKLISLALIILGVVGLNLSDDSEH
mmetsp:Transcript_22584/g.31530  ORF Transcript_22584/g.31530 Transcript_22584/m.31530 type:complete len:365 (+) Transcript_22584:488-1582(+)